MTVVHNIIQNVALKSTGLDMSLSEQTKNETAKRNVFQQWRMLKKTNFAATVLKGRLRTAFTRFKLTVAKAKSAKPQMNQAREDLKMCILMKKVQRVSGRAKSVVFKSFESASKRAAEAAAVVMVQAAAVKVQAMLRRALVPQHSLYHWWIQKAQQAQQAVHGEHCLSFVSVFFWETNTSVRCRCADFCAGGETTDADVYGRSGRSHR